MKSNYNEKGWTLIELIVSLLVLSILIGIVVTAFAYSRQHAEDVACQANLRTIRKQIYFYEKDNTSFPAALDDLKPEYLRESIRFKCSRSHLDYTYDPNTGELSCPYPPHANY
jgi:prepilin-type N-terminal cleavage/methylation domain-containing protein